MPASRIVAVLAPFTLVAGFALLRRGATLSRALPWLALTLVGPSLLVGLLHLALPEDCLSGRTRQ